MEKKIFIGCDHAGFHAKNKLVEYLSPTYFNVYDMGTYKRESCDYPDIAFKVCENVTKSTDHIGIVICGTGIGMSISCNKFNNIRCALCHNTETAELSRKHNNANILALGARLLDNESLINIVNTFLSTDFDGGRHSDRLDKINLLFNKG